MAKEQYVKNYTYIQKIKNPETPLVEQQRLKDRLMKENYGFVFNSVRKLKSGHIVDDDDMQNAFLGIAETLNKFNPEKAKSIGALGFFRIRHNLDKYRFHNAGIRVPKDKLSDVRFRSTELLEDRVDSEDLLSDSSLLTWVCDEAESILSDIEFQVFSYKTFSKLTYKEIALKLSISRLEAMRIYRKAYNNIVTHCRGLVAA